MDLIVCVDNNWAIGLKGDQHVAIPEDRKFFQQVTMGHAIVVGRKTLSTFPNGLPLKGRENIVLTSDRNFTAKGATIVHDIEELKEAVKEVEAAGKDVYCVGGGKVYELLYPYCRYAHVTKVDYAYEADTFFPNLDKLDNWKIVDDSEEHTYFSLEYYFYKYENTDIRPL